MNPKHLQSIVDSLTKILNGLKIKQSMNDELYNVAYSLLGHHLTLDDTIPAVVGCGEAVSFVVNEIASELVPPKGIPGTAGWYEMMSKSARFKEVPEPTKGSIIVSVTGTGNGSRRGHIGIMGNYRIMSNNSDTGLWGDEWTLGRWLRYYKEIGGLTTKYYDLIK